jgi:hypothetical protein
VIPSAFQEQFSGDPVPFVPGTLRGYRQWRVNLGMGLESVSGGYVWPPTLDAVCTARRWPGGSNDHEAPHEGCACGIYACHWPTDDQVMDASVLHPGRTVTGVVEAWGRVQLGARGFRAQHARIIALEFALPMFPNVTGHLQREGPILGGLYYELPNGRTVPASNLHEHWNDPHDWQAQLRRNYPRVTMFRNRAAMIAAFPPVDVSELVPP